MKCLNPNCQKTIPGTAKFCPQCGTPAPMKSGKTGGVRTGDIGYLEGNLTDASQHGSASVGNVFIGTADSHLEVCPICGRRNRPENTFRCKDCGRDYLCLNHQNAQSFSCLECSRPYAPDTNADVNLDPVLQMSDPGAFFVNVINDGAGDQPRNQRMILTLDCPICGETTDDFESCELCYDSFCQNFMDKEKLGLCVRCVENLKKYKKYIDRLGAHEASSMLKEMVNKKEILRDTYEKLMAYLQLKNYQ